MHFSQKKETAVVHICLVEKVTLAQPRYWTCLFVAHSSLYVVQSIVIQNTDLMTDSEQNFCWKVQDALENN